MKFIDEIELSVKAGDGGDGIVAFRREKYRPRCGPSGGDGGRGGDVVLVADENLGTLLDLRYKKRITGENGRNGQGKDMYGRSGCDTLIRVPAGTVVFDRNSNEPIGDLTVHDQRLKVAEGGKGGLGNIRFATPSNRAPRKSTTGRKGEQRELRLELKLLADVGLVGLPGVGKSSIVSKISAAKPKVASYPFTTLTPVLGVVQVAPGFQFTVADIPGIIENASSGAGLGLRFLRHIQRTAVLVYVLALDESLKNNLFADFMTIKKELNYFDRTLAGRNSLVILNKSDLEETRAQKEALEKKLAEQNLDLIVTSSVTGEGLDEFIKKATSRVLTIKKS